MLRVRVAHHREHGLNARRPRSHLATRLFVGWIAGGLLACQASEPVTLERSWGDDQYAVVFFLDAAGQSLAAEPVVVTPASDRIQVGLSWDADYQTVVHLYSAFVGGAMERRGLAFGGEGAPVRAKPQQILRGELRSTDLPGAISLEPATLAEASTVDLRFRGPETRRTYCDELTLESRTLSVTDAVPRIAFGDRDHYFMRLRENDERDRLMVLRADGSIEPYAPIGFVRSPSHLTSNGFGRVFGLFEGGLFEIDPNTSSATIAPVLGTDPRFSAGLAGEMYVWDQLCVEAECSVLRVDDRQRTHVFSAPARSLIMHVLSDQKAVALLSDGVWDFDGSSWTIEHREDVPPETRLLADESARVLYRPGKSFLARYGGAWTCVPDLDTSEDCYTSGALDIRNGARMGEGRFVFGAAVPSTLIIVGPDGLCTRSLPGDPPHGIDVSIRDRALVVPSHRIEGFTRTTIWTVNLPSQ